MTNMETWAERELELAGYKADDAKEGPNKWLREGTLELLKVFGKQGHSGSSAPFAVDQFSRLASWKPLAPLTGDDDEWGTDASPTQNNRFSKVFKDDDGSAYWVDGIVFWEWWTHPETGEKSKAYFTSRGSRVEITFPFTVPDEPEYREKVKD